MNDSTEIARLEDLLQECRSLYANLSERNARAMGGLPEMTEPITLFPGEGEKSEETASERGEGSLPGLGGFEKTLRELQRQFLVTWRSLLKANLEIESLSKGRAKEQSELARLSEQVMLLSQSRAEASEEKSRLRREIELLKVEAVTQKEAATRLEEQLSLREKDLHALAAELAEKEREHRAIAEKEKALTDTVRDLEQIKEHLEERLGSLEKELEHLRSQVEPLERDLTESRNRIAELESELHFTREETVPKQELEKLEEALEQVVSEKERLQREREDLQERLREKEKALDESRVSQDKAAQSLREESAKVESLRQELAAREARIRELQEAHVPGLSEAAITEIEARLTTALTELESYREQFERLEEENRRLKAQLESGTLETVSFEETPRSSREVEPGREVSEELTDPALLERESRVADLESREIENLETETQEVASRVLSGEASTAPEPSESEAVEESRSDSQSAETLGKDPTFVDEADVESPEERDGEKEESDESSGEKDESVLFPYPEIRAENLAGLEGKRVLLVGGDIRFQQDYEHLFHLGKADLDYFPSIIQLEKRGMKNAVREASLVVAFGGATQEPGLFRLRKICTDYGRYLLEHPSSGLVSLSQRLQDAIEKI